jgi:tRNA (cmo5U34)-methyltransferase
MYERSSWTFNQHVTDEFEQHVRKSLPFYERLQEMVASISDYYVSDHEVIYDLGCSTGETISRLQKRHPQKSLRYIGLDSSSSMIEKASNIHPSSCIQFQNAKLEDYSFPFKSPFIVSLLTLHFLPIHKRKIVLQRVYDALHIGGCFVLAEKTHSESPVMQNMWSHLHYDEKLQQGFTHQEVLEKEQSIRGVLIPMSVKENITLLENIGFQVDIFFKEWNFTGFLAIKP